VSLSSSADGQRLVFRTVLTQHNVYEADFADSEKILLRVRRLTFGQGRDDFPRAWTPDSKTILFDSNRNGKWEIFQQEREQVSDEPLVQGENDEFSPRLSPDGRFLLYLDRPGEWREPQAVSLMRAPAGGGFPQIVLQESGFSAWGLRFECAQRAGGPCVLARRTGNEIVFRPFDPERGFNAGRSDVFRMQLDQKRPLAWALAPDGARLAWIGSDAPDATIHVVSLKSGQKTSAQEVKLQGESHLHAVNWSPDGKGWYVTTRLPASWTIIRETLEGRVQVLWQGLGEYAPEAWPSPDGRHIAFSQQEQDSNVWMLEKF
jgi:Tol biopolymer transport system component